MLVGMRARRISCYSFEGSPSILASSGSITGISSRTGYTRRQFPHFSPDPSLSNSTRVLHTGQTRMSRAYFGIKFIVSAEIQNRFECVQALYQTASIVGNSPPRETQKPPARIFGRSRLGYAVRPPAPNS
jgi:hypothetical protein